MRWVRYTPVGFDPLESLVPIHCFSPQIASLRVHAGELGQMETVQKCLQNGAWVEGLFDRFGELISQVQQACQ